MKEILVIKLSALGDFIQALGPAKAIREHHKDDKITLLTTKIYENIAKKSNLFDEIIIDERPKFFELKKWFELGKKLSKKNFYFVYDLQTSGRSNRYYCLMKLFGSKPYWSGIAKGCSHPNANKNRDYMHTIERQAEQLKDAGIMKSYFPDISWLQSDISQFKLSENFALIVAGGAPHRPEKRWDAKKYATLANKIYEMGITPVVIGTKAEENQVKDILDNCKNAVSLLGKTTIEDIASLAMKAKFAVGNDTGPMHMIAIANCPTVVLYSNASDPKLCGQRGKNVKIIKKPSLNDVRVEEVLDILKIIC